MKEAKSFDGIIAYLTRKCNGGNVQEAGIVTITSKSVGDSRHSLKNAADLTLDSYFKSEDEPGQWICWDFREMRVRPTHYTIATVSLKSWIVEGSSDGRSWAEIDHRTESTKGNTSTRPISNPRVWRFIRLTQTAKSHDRDDTLSLRAVEFFGTIS
jgi:hypothetical protein